MMVSMAARLLVSRRSLVRWGGCSWWPRLWATIALALSATAGAWAQGSTLAGGVLPVPALSGRVVDTSAVLAGSGRAQLESRLERIERERGSQVVVLTVPTTAPEDIAAYAQRVGEAWKIGRRDQGDGILIVVAVDDRRVAIQTTKALEGALPDLAAKRIIDQQIRPAFRAGDYALGLLSAVDQIGLAISKEGLPAPAPADPRWGSEGQAPDGDWQSLLMFFFVAVPVAAMVLTGMFGRRLGSLLTAASAGGLAWVVTASVALAAGAAVAAWVFVGLFGFGAMRRGGLSSGRATGSGPVIWGGGHHGGGWSSGGFGGGGGGGFSSGGGGDFGGGGASGSW